MAIMDKDMAGKNNPNPTAKGELIIILSLILGFGFTKWQRCKAKVRDAFRTNMRTIFERKRPSQLEVARASRQFWPSPRPLVAKGQ